MNIFLYGTDTFRSRQQLKKMVEKFKTDRDPQGLNVAMLDCATEDLGKVLEQVLASPFLAEKRMVVLENALTATGKKDLQTELFERIKNKKISEDTILLFWESGAKPKTDVAKKLYKMLQKEKFAQEFGELKGSGLGSWVKQEVEMCGGKINAGAVQHIVNNVGDSWFIHSLISQLTSYTDKEITLEDVQLFIDEKQDDNIFNLVDAIVAGQTKKVYTMIREQYAKGEDAQYIFAMMLRQFRILLELRDVFDREDNPRSDVLAKQLGLHPFVVKKSIPFIKRYSLSELTSIYNKLLEFDIKTKTGQGDQSVMLDVFVSSII
ncbi:DNA polymerase III subunit delta [Candidatus Parcubacteria bacterium]|nr:MAG: DNA polymerase III subunit delta [Candidatus Parcubacteria bacterium]